MLSIGQNELGSKLVILVCGWVWLDWAGSTHQQLFVGYFILYIINMLNI